MTSAVDFEQLVKDWGPLVSTGLTFIAIWLLGKANEKIKGTVDAAVEKANSAQKNAEDALKVVNDQILKASQDLKLAQANIESTGEKTSANLSETTQSLEETQRELTTAGRTLVSDLAKAGTAIDTSSQGLGAQVTNLQREMRVLAEYLMKRGDPEGVLVHEYANPPDKAIVSDGSNIQHWERLSNAWAECKLSIEGIIASIGDGRTRRKYNSLTRHNYEPIILALLNDELISENTHDLLNDANQLFLDNRVKPWATNEEAAKQVERAQDAIASQLAEIESSDSDGNAEEAEEEYRDYPILVSSVEKFRDNVAMLNGNLAQFQEGFEPSRVRAWYAVRSSNNPSHWQFGPSRLMGYGPAHT